MNYREIIDEAISQLATYRHPNTEEAEKLLSDILKAAGLGSLEHEHVDDISIYGGSVHIETSWSARGCGQNSSYSFPVSLLDAEDPLKAAKIWGLNEKISETESERDRYASYVASHNERIAKYKAELEAA